MTIFHIGDILNIEMYLGNWTTYNNTNTWFFSKPSEKIAPNIIEVNPKIIRSNGFTIIRLQISLFKGFWHPALNFCFKLLLSANAINWQLARLSVELSSQIIGWTVSFAYSFCRSFTLNIYIYSRLGWNGKKRYKTQKRIQSLITYVWETFKYVIYFNNARNKDYIKINK